MRSDRGTQNAPARPSAKRGDLLSPGPGQVRGVQSAEKRFNGSRVIQPPQDFRRQPPKLRSAIVQGHYEPMHSWGVLEPVGVSARGRPWVSHELCSGVGGWPRRGRSLAQFHSSRTGPESGPFGCNLAAYRHRTWVVSKEVGEKHLRRRPTPSATCRRRFRVVGSILKRGRPGHPDCTDPAEPASGPKLHSLRHPRWQTH